MDICIPIFRNYALAYLQEEWWRENIKGNYRLIIGDNTPAQEKQHINLNLEIHQFNTDNYADGVSHGQCLDKLTQIAQSPIIGYVDSDFFWLDPNILSYVEDLFEKGYRAVGCAGFYRDFQSRIDPRHPHRAGHLAPICWGMFVDKNLVKDITFVVDHEKIAQFVETGWRLRDHLIKNKIPTVIFPGSYESINHSNTIFNLLAQESTLFWKPHLNEPPLGIHFLKGSQAHGVYTPWFKPFMEEKLKLWKY